MTDSPETVEDQAELIAILRAAAVLLEQANLAYDYHRLNGDWSPKSLRYEADYLERHA